MDYEVFLVARVLEARRSGLSELEAIPEGLARTAGLITSAAAIMIVVFAAFTFGSFLVIKMLGFTLAVAVLIDATLVRIVIGPALLRVAGDWNWWPGGLSRSQCTGDRQRRMMRIDRRSSTHSALFGQAMGGNGCKWMFDCIPSVRLVRNQDFRGMSWQVWDEPPKQESRGQGSRQLGHDEQRNIGGLNASESVGQGAGDRHCRVRERG